MKTPKIERAGDGRFVFRITINGVRQRVYSDTEEEARAKIAAYQTRILELRKHPDSITPHEAIENYIAERKAVLSPATIRGYRTIQRNRFQTIMRKPISSIANWQRIVNEEAKKCGAKTLKNAWGLLSSAITATGVNVPEVRLPMVPQAQRPWLEPEQIPVFLKAIEGKPFELPAILALHGLRRSEIYGLTFDNVNLAKGWMRVYGAVVPDENSKYVQKDTNKNDKSTRTVPILIPRLRTLLFIAEASADGEQLVVDGRPDSLLKQVNRVCRSVGLPEVGVHGLRHSFASLAYDLGLSEQETMELGGWSDPGTMRKIYTHLSQRKRTQATEKLAGFFKTAGQ